MSDMRIAYLPLEPYKERYTELLCGWTMNAWEDLNDSPLTTIYGRSFHELIQTGPVLDAHGRCVYSLSQIAHLAELLRMGEQFDVIYLDDMFSPGYEALPYILDQLPASQKRPLIYTYNFAQSVDIYDFTYKMRRWMRHYEQIVSETCAGVFVASEIHEELMRVAGLECPVHVVGHQLDSESVRQIAGLGQLRWDDREQQVVFNSRFDSEKQPHFFMDLVERLSDQYKFVVCTGSKELRSNDKFALGRALQLEYEGKLTIARDMTKHTYYEILGRSRVHFNCALQDFISYGLLEASALGTITIVPAYRSFVGLFTDPAHYYIPWNLDHAIQQVHQAMRGLFMADEVAAPSLASDQALSRMHAIMKTDYEREKRA
jgi:glycosyltransferase involved in cell wall biosynthesis